MRISGFRSLPALVLGASAVVGVTFFANSSAQAQGANPTARPVVTLRVVGSIVKNHKGEVLGRIEAVVLNAESGQIDFGMVLVDYPQNTTRTTPVPWFLLKHVSDQGQSGGVPGVQQVFQLNIERPNLVKAPALNKSQWNWLSNPEWRHSVYGYYGYYPTVAANTSAPAAGVAMPTAEEATTAPVYIGENVTLSGGSSYFSGSGFGDYGSGFPYYSGGAFGSGFGFGFQGGSTIPFNFPALFPGGEPVIPNNPSGNIFAASTNFFPGAPARLPRDNNLKVPFGTKAEPLNPGQPWSVTVPEGAKQAVAVNPGQPWSVTIPEGAQQAVSAAPGSPWSVLIPAGAQQAVPNNPGQTWSVLVPADATKAQAVNPGSPFSVTVPAGTTAGTTANQSPWSVIVPQTSTAGNNANNAGSASPFTIAKPQSTSGTRVSGSAWSPIVSSTPTVSTPQNGQFAAFNGNGGFQGGSPNGFPQGGFRGFGGGGLPFRSGIGLAPLAPLAPLARPGPMGGGGGGRHR